MVNAFKEFVQVLTEFVSALLPFDLAGVIVVVIGIVLALAVWRIVT